MLSAPSQVLVRNAEYFAAGKWLLVNPADAAIFTALDNPTLFGFHQYLDIYQQCAQGEAAPQHCFAASYDQQQDFDGAIIYMPKSKQQAQMLINNMAAVVKPGAQIFLVGENKSGIKSAAKLFAAVATQVNKVDSARHCALYCASIEQPSQFSLNDWVTYRSLSAAGQTCEIAFIPGVFSVNELDAGTQLLLENLPPNLTGKVLDFACGAGVIGCWLKLNYPQISVTLSDISAIALHCSKLSLQANQLQADVVASDGLNDIHGQFDGIFTNPPFHTGLSTDYSITQRLLVDAKQRLRTGGLLQLVANRFLPYPDGMKNVLGNVSTVAQTSKFSLYRSVRKK